MLQTDQTGITYLIIPAPHPVLTNSSVSARHADLDAFTEMISTVNGNLIIASAHTAGLAKCASLLLD